MTKTLVLIRHGHRDTSERELDNGLDAKGQGQAKCIEAFFHKRFSESKEVRLVSSPKKRCQQTLKPLADSLRLKVETHSGLDEQHRGESESEFHSRLIRFIKEWKDSEDPITVVCSHGDWLPLAVHKLIGVQQDFKKGSWLEIELSGGHASLTWYIPSFKFFGGFLTK